MSLGWPYSRFETRQVDFVVVFPIFPQFLFFVFSLITISFFVFSLTIILNQNLYFTVDFKNRNIEPSKLLFTVNITQTWKMSTMDNFISAVDTGYTLTTFFTLDILFQELETITRQGLVVDHVNRQTYQDICAERAKRGRRYRFTQYLPRFQVLIIAMPNPRHDAASRHLECVIAQRVDAMGLGGDWRYEGSITYFERLNGELLCSREGTSAGRPRSLRSSILDWPTMAVECGPSDSMLQLREKALWWFTASGDDVKVVLLFEVNTFTECITIEKWGVAQCRGRDQSLIYTPHCDQRVIITRVTNTSDTIPITSYVVFFGPLRLDFETLFLRQPRKDSSERDIIISNYDLRRLAAAILDAEGGRGEA